ncbi:hypothetical protein V500_04839 [Pseudogymnoascus sp. VKM F-4518 (FW-2643)]|nr:hypothetical protein V500_04839 [Pseudogymnoascus sp. VKM F-4518 (FW-2643)]
MMRTFCKWHISFRLYSPFVHLLGLCALALQAKRYCEVVHAAERVWVILPEHCLPELQRLPVHRLGLRVLSLLAERLCHVVHAAERVWVILPEHRLPELQRLSVHRLSLCTPALLLKRLCHVVHDGPIHPPSASNAFKRIVEEPLADVLNEHRPPLHPIKWPLAALGQTVQDNESSEDSFPSLDKLFQAYLSRNAAYALLKSNRPPVVL